MDPKEWVPPLYKCNIYIKEVCQLAKLNTPVQLIAGSGDHRKEKVLEKWQLITTHTAPRTFINLMVDARVPEHIICGIVGKSPRTLFSYKQVSDRDVEKAFEAWG